MFNHHDITRDALMLHGPLAHQGYDWWWHSFTAQDAASQSTDGGTLSSVTNLKEGQLELVQAVAAAYKKTIVVCNNGDAFNVGAFRDDVDAILEMWWPGQEGGSAMANLLLGKAAPNGKLPVSYPVNEERIVARNAEH